MIQNPIISVNRVSKSYQAHKALSEVTFQIPQGSVFGLLGPNGAGKTSLIRILTRITAADSGEVYYNGNLLHEGHIRQIGYLPEERGLYRKMQVQEQLVYLAMLKGLSRHDATKRSVEWMEKFDLGSRAKRKLEELSKGMQQKVQFIATVIHEPELLILDEPFSGFDPINAGLITQEINRMNRQGCSIVFSTHRMESVEQLCDHIALIHKSRNILDGRVADIRRQYRTRTWEVQYEGLLKPSPEWTPVSTVATGDGQFISRFQLNEGQQSNDLLRELVDQIRISRFEELLPGMEEIFMRAVSLN